MTYVEGASLHQERGGSTVFARYAFNELLSFVAGWAILLDYMILIAVTAITAANYLGARSGRRSATAVEVVVALGDHRRAAVANVLRPHGASCLRRAWPASRRRPRRCRSR